ncbi:transposase IS200 family protein [Marinobacter sp. LV10MA510-1]|nr:transposase IS200 family protein [Marinobacter sp. LV10MA510-1]PFG53368.1 transposase IS200 family protein [Marinobacter sp. LV10R520-4]
MAIPVPGKVVPLEQGAGVRVLRFTPAFPFRCNRLSLSRENRREMIFASDDNRRAFCQFSTKCETFNRECHAHCLMGNHYHLLIETISLDCIILA